MQLLAILAAATGAAAVAMPNVGVAAGLGNGHSKGWGLKKFKNLVAFGDRYERLSWSDNWTAN